MQTRLCSFDLTHSDAPVFKERTSQELDTTENDFRDFRTFQKVSAAKCLTPCEQKGQGDQIARVGWVMHRGVAGHRIATSLHVRRFEPQVLRCLAAIVDIKKKTSRSVKNAFACLTELAEIVGICSMMDTCAFTHEHPRTRRCTIHPRTLHDDTAPKHNNSRQFRTHLEQFLNSLVRLDQQRNGSSQHLSALDLETLESDVSSGKSAGAIAMDSGWPSSFEIRELIEKEHGRMSVKIVLNRFTVFLTSS